MAADESADDYVYDETSGEWLPAADVRARAVAADTIEVRDAVGNLLADGDQVTLIKDLAVKGSSMVAKRGTSVRGIRLVRDNPEQIEGRVNDQQIVILCQYVKKT